MGWPEFQKCCGCLTLTTGTIVIGCWCLITGLVSFSLHTMYITFVIQLAQSEADVWIPILEYFLAGFAMITDMIYSVIGIMLIIFSKNAKYLGKLVFYMIVLGLTNLLVVLIGISTDSRFEHYISALLVLLDGYFILIVRSNQLQLEGRLTNPVDVRRRRPLEPENVITDSAYHNDIFPSPPPYEEAVRYGALHRIDIAVALSPTEEMSNADRIEPNLMIPTLQEGEQPVATSSNNDSVKKDAPKEPEYVIYDERQFTAISDTQVVERTIVNNETDQILKTEI